MIFNLSPHSIIRAAGAAKEVTPGERAAAEASKAALKAVPGHWKGLGFRV